MPPVLRERCECDAYIARRVRKAKRAHRGDFCRKFWKPDRVGTARRSRLCPRGKCLHYYFYFMDAELGLIHLRVPTWCPFRLQFYCNGHSWLARQLSAAAIDFAAADNAFLRIGDWEHAQRLADSFSPDLLHRILDHYAELCCPVLDVFEQRYHWSLTQVEYSTDLVFRSPAMLRPLYEQLCRQAVLSVKAEHVATFLGHKITSHLVQEIGSQFSTRIEGTCIKHHFGKSTVKMYDKFARVLRLETTTNNVSAFKHHRKVEHRQGPSTRRIAPVKKSIYSLRDLQDILLACNRRYLAYLSALDDFSAGARALDQVTRPRRIDGKTMKPINFFNRMEQAVLRALQCPASAIAGLRRADLSPHLTDLSPAAISRYISRLRKLGLLKRIQRHLSLLPHQNRARRRRSLFPSSPRTFSFPPSHDKIFAQNVKS